MHFLFFRRTLWQNKMRMIFYLPTYPASSDLVLSTVVLAI